MENRSEDFYASGSAERNWLLRASVHRRSNSLPYIFGRKKCDASSPASVSSPSSKPPLSAIRDSSATRKVKKSPLPAKKLSNASPEVTSDITPLVAGTSCSGGGGKMRHVMTADAALGGMEQRGGMSSASTHPMLGQPASSDNNNGNAQIPVGEHEHYDHNQSDYQLNMSSNGSGRNGGGAPGTSSSSGGGMGREGGGGGSGGSDVTGDDIDGADFHLSLIDPARTQHAIEQLNGKMQRTMGLIKEEQEIKEESVNEYLRLSANADKQQAQRIKALFEKKNQKSTANIATLQRKLDAYQRRLREVELHGVTSHRQPKEVLKDVGQGLKDVGANIRDGITGFSGGVVDNIRGAKETIVSKPKEFAHLFKNKFGSADNINNIKNLDDQYSSPNSRLQVDDGHDKTSLHSGVSGREQATTTTTTGTGGGNSSGLVLPSSQEHNVTVQSSSCHQGPSSSSGGGPPPSPVPSGGGTFRTGNSMFYTPAATTPVTGPGYNKYHQYGSDDDGGSSITSESAPRSTSPRPHSDYVGMLPKRTASSSGLPSISQQQNSNMLRGCATPAQPITPGAQLATMTDIQKLKEQQEEQNEALIVLHEDLHILRVTVDESVGVKQTVEELRFRIDGLEEQINDLTDLHQHEMTNIKTELSSMEEKMEYQLDERTRDMQELLESCQTRITKMELQQQQQHQLISMDGIENTNFRALLTKLINVLLAMLAVVLVLVSTVAGLLGPFLNSRVRILSTAVVVIAVTLAWQNSQLFQNWWETILQKFQR